MDLLFSVLLMKDNIKRSIVITLFGLFLLYLVYLIIQWENIVKSEFAGRNIPVYVILILFCLYMLVLYWLYPIHIKLSRATSLVIWLLLIVISQRVLANDGYSHIYIWDMFSVLGVVILILFPTNILTTEKENEVIIEV